MFIFLIKYIFNITGIFRLNTEEIFYNLWHYFPTQQGVLRV